MPDSYTTSDSTLQLDLAPTGPRREALERALRSAIRAGRLGPGDRIPSTRALALDLGLSRGTVVEAYVQLTAEGYLDATRGSGTRVSHLGPAALAVAPAVPSSGQRARYSFHPGLPDLTAFPRAAWTSCARRGLRDIPAHELGYGDPRGRAELRAELARYLGRARGAAADPERIVVCAGFLHGLSLLCRALRRQGARRIAMEDPCLPKHRDAAAAAGLEVVPLPVDEHGARTDLLARSRVSAVVLGPAHQYPLGVVLHPDRRAAAVAWARWSGGLVIEDDYDAELRFDRAPIGVLQALDPNRVAYGGSVSKTLAPGLRLGWLLVPAVLMDSITVIRETEDIHVSVTDQLALTGMLRSGAYERHVRRMRVRYRARRDRVVEMLEARVPSVRAVGISAGLRVLLILPRDTIGGDELAAHAAAESIELFPVGPCAVGRRTASDGVLVGYGALPEHDFEAGLDRLGDLLVATLGSA